MDNKYVFVSVVGTQFMGTLQPLMTLVDMVGPVRSIFLMTPKMRGNGDHLKDFIERHNLGTVEFMPVEQTLGMPDSAPAVVKRIAEEASAKGERICLNVDGGLNYLLAAIVLELEEYKPLYVQTSQTRGVICDTETETYKRRKLPEVLPVEEILNIQKVNYRKDVKDNPDYCPSLPFSEYISRHRIPLPENALRNVEIEGVFFDVVWNPGNNRLYFLKDWRFSTDDTDRLARERAFANWCKNRKLTADMHDKQITALVWDDKSEQRLRENSSGKISVVNINKDHNLNDDIENLKKALNVKLPKISEEDWKQPDQASLARFRPNTLVTPIGTNAITTFLAICSHKPDHLVLCYDIQTPQVKETAERIRDLAPMLGLKSVELVNLTVEGVHPFSILPTSDETRVDVNISPGSKGQLVGLARWATRNGHNVWSIENSKRVCSPLTRMTENSPIPLDIWDPSLITKLMNLELLDEGATHKHLNEEGESLDAMLKFMRYTDEAGLDINEAFLKNFLKVGKHGIQKRNGNRWKLTIDGKKYNFNKEEKGAWFEKLCARALMNAGASRLRTNMKLRWNEENERDLLKKHANPVNMHSLELDVVACFEGDILLVSAKSYELKDTDKSKNDKIKTMREATNEANNTAQYLGPFALSCVADLGSGRSFLENRVSIIGWRDLCRPEVLAERIKALRSSRHTTL